MPAENQETHLRLVVEREEGTPLRGERHAGGNEIRVAVFERVALLRDRTAPIQVPQTLVVRVQDEKPVAWERLRQLALRPRHLVHRAKRLEVSGAGVREHADVRRREKAQLADLAGRAHAHLEHEHLVLRSESGERERDPDVVVQIPPVLVHAVARPQHRRDHLLRRGLAVRAGHRRDRHSRFRAAVPSQRLERPERIPHRHDRLPRHGPGRITGAGLRDEGAPRGSLERRGDEVVSVRARPRERHEKVALRERAAVDRAGPESRMRPDLLDRIEERSLRHAQHLLEREPGTHDFVQRLNPFRLSASRAASRSSNGSVFGPMI